MPSMPSIFLRDPLSIFFGIKLNTYVHLGYAHGALGDFAPSGRARAETLGKKIIELTGSFVDSLKSDPRRAVFLDKDSAPN